MYNGPTDYGVKILYDTERLEHRIQISGVDGSPALLVKQNHTAIVIPLSAGEVCGIVDTLSQFVKE
jgi:hypothetical protein